MHQFGNDVFARCGRKGIAQVTERRGRRHQDKLIAFLPCHACLNGFGKHIQKMALGPAFQRWLELRRMMNGGRLFAAVGGQSRLTGTDEGQLRDTLIPVPVEQDARVGAVCHHNPSSLCR